MLTLRSPIKLSRQETESDYSPQVKTPKKSFISDSCKARNSILRNKSLNHIERLQNLYLTGGSSLKKMMSNFDSPLVKTPRQFFTQGV